MCTCKLVPRRIRLNWQLRELNKFTFNQSARVSTASMFLPINSKPLRSNLLPKIQWLLWCMLEVKPQGIIYRHCSSPRHYRLCFAVVLQSAAYSVLWFSLAALVNRVSSGTQQISSVKSPVWYLLSPKQQTDEHSGALKIKITWGDWLYKWEGILDFEMD